jgi:transcription termination factor Rho
VTTTLEKSPKKTASRPRNRTRANGNGAVKARADAAARPLVPVSGILDVRGNSAYLRTGGYRPGDDDVRVTPAQVQELGLRPGDLVTGTARGDRLAGADRVNGAEPGSPRPAFADMTPVHPDQVLRLETAPRAAIGRVIDLVAPIGKGQRGLIVAPPKAGKTLILQAIARAVTVNHPDAHLMVVLVGERPEEVTEFRRTIDGEVAYSTFDQPEREHTTVAELAVERAKRLVELGHDVVLLLDSLTRLGRAYNTIAPNGGRILSGGIDTRAIYPPKRFFGAARNVIEGGSLTIIATALVETGSRMDDGLFEEFKGTGNMELRLSRALAEQRLYPAVDVHASSTRRDELLLPAGELAAVTRLRRALSALDRRQATESLLTRLRQTSSNTELLRLAGESVGA